MAKPEAEEAILGLGHFFRQTDGVHWRRHPVPTMHDQVHRWYTTHATHAVQGGRHALWLMM